MVLFGVHTWILTKLSRFAGDDLDTRPCGHVGTAGRIRTRIYLLRREVPIQFGPRQYKLAHREGVEPTTVDFGGRRSAN